MCGFLRKTYILTLLVIMIPFRIAASSNNPVASCVADSVVHDSITGTAHITFPISLAEIQSGYGNNARELGRISKDLHSIMSDSTLTLHNLTIHGFGSIDGPYRLNEKVSRQRTDSVAAFISGMSNLSDGCIVTRSTAEDWKGFKQYVEKSSTEQMPHKEEILRIINSTREPDAKEWLIKSTYPEDYKYLIANCMPQLRRSDYTIDYVKASHIGIREAVAMPETAAVFVADTTAVSTQEEPKKKSLLFALKTNMLYDAALIPNLGIEVYMGKRWTIALDWFYTWFSSNNRHRYWQAYGGYLGVRKYLGGNNNQTSDIRHQTSRVFPVGHHLGAYILGLTYDVEWGGKGYQASKFGFGGGLEYGYSKMIGRRWSIDFSVGVGFQDGEYKEYEPANDGTGHYLWLATKKRHWWGPTKAEVSLKWLFGTKGNKQKKGGKR